MVHGIPVIQELAIKSDLLWRYRNDLVYAASTHSPHIRIEAGDLERNSSGEEIAEFL